MGLAAPASPQDVTAPCRLCEPESIDRPTTSRPRRSASRSKPALDFDQLILAGTGDGTAELVPDGTRSVSGSVTAISARAMVGEVVVRGEPGRLVRIELASSDRALSASPAARSASNRFAPTCRRRRGSIRQWPAELPIRRNCPRFGRRRRRVSRRCADRRRLFLVALGRSAPNRSKCLTGRKPYH